MFTHILVPTDGSALSDAAVKEAVAFAKDTKARITFFYAEPDHAASLLDADGALLRTIDPQTLADSIDRRISEVLGKARSVADAEGVFSDVLSAVSDEPHEAIIAAAHQSKCDLILMASHGRHGVKGLLLGSQTQKVLVHSKIPVLVYR